MQAEGQPFDPNQHQAISYEETTEAPDGTVLKVLQQGYLIRDRILRPALVAVARNDDPSSPSNGKDHTLQLENNRGAMPKQKLLQPMNRSDF